MNSVAKPVLFNLFKHHLNYIRYQIGQINDQSGFDSITDKTKIIGDSQMDLYYGEMPPGDIVKNILRKIEQKNYSNYKNYLQWINSDGLYYRVIQLIDDSFWVCRVGIEDHERYVHIHPARNSALTLRVKANALKTAILLLAYIKINTERELSEELISYIRERHLNLSPVKSTDKLKELDKLISLIKY